MEMKFTYLRNGVTLKLNADKCTGCEMCVEVCPHSVFSMNQKKAVVTDRGSCMECGACKMNCPAKAIEVKVGVGCAGAILRSIVTGKEASCGCSDDGKTTSCCG